MCIKVKIFFVLIHGYQKMYNRVNDDTFVIIDPIIARMLSLSVLMLNVNMNKLCSFPFPKLKFSAPVLCVSSFLLPPTRAGR